MSDEERDRVNPRPPDFTNRLHQKVLAVLFGAVTIAFVSIIAVTLMSGAAW